MPRTIKFRAWDAKNVRMTYAFWVGSLSGIPFWATSSEPLVIEPIQSQFTVMQYTGLKDRTGREIYEGDIVKCGYNGEDIAAIEFSNGGFGYNDTTWNYWQKEFAHDDMEVIGNHFENPELLGKEKV